MSTTTDASRRRETGPALAPDRIGAGLFQPRTLLTSLPDALRKLDPRALVRNPVMFVVEVGSALTTVLAILKPSVFAWSVTVWLWLTVLFANLAEAVAEGRGGGRPRRCARRRPRPRRDDWPSTAASRSFPRALSPGDRVVVAAGEVMPGDGDVIEGVATVDESAITGESAPVIREAGGDRSAVTGGTKVLSDRIVVQITARAGETSP